MWFHRNNTPLDIQLGLFHDTLERSFHGTSVLRVREGELLGLDPDGIERYAPLIKKKKAGSWTLHLPEVEQGAETVRVLDPLGLARLKSGHLFKNLAVRGVDQKKKTL